MTLTLTMKMTGEHFELLRSARSQTGDGHFHFRWTLDAGKKGPPEHFHEGETETFRIVSGVLRIWIEDTPRDYHAGERVSIPPRVRHRFLNPGEVPVVVDVDLDGPNMEDGLVPMALHFNSRTSLKLSEIPRIIVHDVTINASTPASPAAHTLMRTVATIFKALGARGFERVDGWDDATTASARTAA